ncbi:MAG: RNA polymerase factor sigma-54 [Pseudomonadota bacterium]|nr:RNA polymerase factor sigma-54 [Pseudomonadota bacterium]
MSLIPRIELKRGQSLVMTPQLQQAIKLLQFSNLELSQFVEKELAENPLLERDDGQLLLEDRMAEEHGANDDTHSDETVDGTAGGERLELSTSADRLGDLDNGLDMDEFDNVWDHDSSSSIAQSSMTTATDWKQSDNAKTEYPSNNLEQTLSHKPSLRDHLINQIRVEMRNPIERRVAIFLLDNLDDNGRLTEDISELSVKIGWNVTKMEDVLEKLQGFDPPGIFSRNLTECWAIQLREKNRLDPAMETLIANTELLKVHDYKKLAKLCHVEVDEITDMINEIWALSHNPSEAFENVIAQPVNPDVTMRRGAKDKWLIELNNNELPKVLVNHSYYAEISSTIQSGDDKKYITEKLQSANWLVKSLHQRAVTILKVATEIVSQQEDFFKYGVEYLKPLVLRNIAEEIEMHESTVSRVTSNKFIDTPRGIYELKYFFTAAIGSSEGGHDFSSESVRYKIKHLITNEEATAVLSDDKVVKLLRTEGIDIARRTVAKYRETMNIPSSVIRRKQKNHKN